MKGKRGVSIVIGYVILVAMAITMSFLVYAWMKSYVPKDKLECPDDVSIRITKAYCDKSGDYNVIVTEVKNTGRFDIQGYVVKGKNKDGVLIELSEGYRLFQIEKLAPNVGKVNDAFGKKTGRTLEKITSVEITPIRSQIDVETEKENVVICGDAVVSRTIDECEIFPGFES